MRVRRVQKGHLEMSAQAPWCDPARRPFVDGELAYVPVRDGYPCDFELAERETYHGRGYQVLGDTVVFHGPRPAAAEVEAVVDWVRPRGVLWIQSLSGETRTPETELLWGERGEVCHHENGCRYWLDPSRIMFAMGNRKERARMGAVVRKGERIGDLCAGIGYFTIPMARAGAHVHAIEINPSAYTYLLRSVAANGVDERVQAVCGDCRTSLSGYYDRLVIGHFDMLSFLPPALAHVGEGSTLHLHSLDCRGDAIRGAVETAGFSPIMAIHRVKKYAPGRWHVVWDVML
jgi:tRNA wybutosine-synthesizing protein 2